MFKVKIDCRETKLKAFFKNYSYISIEKLDQGDIIFQWGESDKDCWIIERKTVSDFAHSIKDGRFREQKIRLLANYPSNRILYLIEGNLNVSAATEVETNVPMETLYSSIYNMILRDNIQVYKTANIDETIRFVKNFICKIKKQGTEFINSQYSMMDYHKSNMKLGKKKNIDRPTCFLYQLCQIPGVSLPISKKIVERFSSWKNMNQQLEKKHHDSEKFNEIACIQVGLRKNGKPRRLGENLACRIYTFLFT
jgi:ERCC4-type nuclease